MNDLIKEIKEIMEKLDLGDTCKRTILRELEQNDGTRHLEYLKRQLQKELDGRGIK
jgi:hypothetical protein